MIKIKEAKEIQITTKRGDYILWDEAGVIKGTTPENYNAYVRNERQVQKFDGFTFDEAIEYVKKYF